MSIPSHIIGPLGDTMGLGAFSSASSPSVPLTANDRWWNALSAIGYPDATWEMNDAFTSTPQATSGATDLDAVSWASTRASGTVSQAVEDALAPFAPEYDEVMSFDTINTAGMVIPTTAVTNPQNDHTLIMWVRIDPASSSDITLFQNTDPTTAFDGVVYRYVEATGKLGASFWNTGTQQTYSGSIVITKGQWHMLTFVMTGTTFVAYVDGALDGTRASCSIGARDQALNPRFWLNHRGRMYRAQYWDGQALNINHVQQLWNAVQYPENTAMNLLTTNQASIETSAAGWSVNTNCTLARSTAQAASGSASLAMTSLAAGAMSSNQVGLASGLVPGAPYVIRAEFRAATISRFCFVYINYFDAGGNYLSGVYSMDNVPSTTTGWTVVSQVVTPPANATQATLQVGAVSIAGAGEVQYVDKIALYAGTDPTWTGL